MGVTQNAPRWWVILWMTWGIVLAALSALLHENLFLASFWLIGGGFAAQVVPFAKRFPLSPLLEWYRDLVVGTDWRNRMRNRMLCYLNRQKLIPEELPEVDIRDKSREIFLKDELLICMVLCSLMVGVFHGILIGPIVEAFRLLFTGTTELAEIKVARWLLVGPIALSTLNGIIMACFYRSRSGLPLRTQLLRRGLLVLSVPLLVLATLHCLINGLRRSAKSGSSEA